MTTNDKSQKNEPSITDAQAASRAFAVSKGFTEDPSAPKIPGYSLSQLLGRSVFAEVWKAWQVRSLKWVAIKVFIRREEVDWTLMQREIERLVRMDKHPRIVPLLETELNGPAAYCVMELMEVGSLKQYTEAAKTPPVEKAVRWMEEIAAALCYTHSKGIIHCDIKPSNLMLDEAGHIRVLDFGQARLFSESLGDMESLFFMAPEQAVLHKKGAPSQPDVRWDIFSLGATMYALLTGKTPNGQPSNRNMMEESLSLEDCLKVYRDLVGEGIVGAYEVTKGRVDEDLSAIISKCLAPKPENRYASMAEVVADLSAWREHRPVSPLAFDKKYQIKRFLQRNEKPVAIACAVLAALLLGGIQVIRSRSALSKKHIATEEKKARLEKDLEASLDKSSQIAKELAYSFILRAEHAAEKEDDEAAALLYAQSNFIQPSRLAAASALSYLEALPNPVKTVRSQASSAFLLFSPDGNRAVFQTNPAAYDLIDLTNGQILSQLAGMAEGSPAAFSFDGKRLATGSGKTIQQWDAVSGQPLGQPIETGEPVKTILYSQDGGELLAASQETARLWDAESGKPLGKTIRANFTHLLALSPDGRRLAAGGFDGVTRLWDARSAAPIGVPLRQDKSLPPSNPLPGTLAFSPNGKTLWSAVRGTTGRLLDSAAGIPLTAPIALESAALSAQFSPDGKTLALGFAENNARLLSAASGKFIGPVLRHVPQSEGRVTALAFNSDGTKILTGSSDGTARLWSVPVGAPLASPLRHEGGVLSAAFSSLKNTIAVGAQDGTLALWDAGLGRAADDWIKSTGESKVTALSLDGKILAAAATATGRLVKIQTGEFIGRPMPLGGDPLKIIFSPDGARAASVSFSSRDQRAEARLWDASSADAIGGSLCADADKKTSVFSPDGKTFAAACPDGLVRLWDAANAQPLGRPMEAGRALVVVFRPETQELLTGAANGEIRFWDSRTGEPRSRVYLPQGQLILELTPDGKRALATSEDLKSLTLWNLANGKAVGDVLRFPYPVSKTALSPDGKYFAIASGKTIRMLDGATGEAVGKSMTAAEAGSPIDSLVFTPDGQTLISKSGGNSVRFWDRDTGEPIGKGLNLGDGAALGGQLSTDGLRLVVPGRPYSRIFSIEWLRQDASPEALKARAEKLTRASVDAQGNIIKNVSTEPRPAAYRPAAAQIQAAAPSSPAQPAFAQNAFKNWENKSQADRPKPAAVVNGVEISQERLNERLAAMIAQNSGAAPTGQMPPGEYRTRIQDVLQDLIDEELVLQAAAKLTPAEPKEKEVKDYFDRLTAYNKGDPAALKETDEQAVVAFKRSADWLKKMDAGDNFAKVKEPLAKRMSDLRLRQAVSRFGETAKNKASIQISPAFARP